MIVKVEMATTPETWGKMKETRHRLENCWKLDINWSLFPDTLQKVSRFKLLVNSLVASKQHGLQGCSVHVDVAPVWNYTSILKR